MRRGRAALAAAAIALPILLDGCVAIVAIPAVLGSGLMVRSNQRVRAATKVPRGPPTVELQTAEAKAAVAGVPDEGLAVTKLTELPKPEGGSAQAAQAAAPWEPFFAYALAQAQAKPAQSAVLAPGSRTDKPLRHACPSPTAAVVVDLDDGASPFVPGRAPPAVSAKVGEGLAKLRQAGVVVLWITALPAARAAEVAQWVRSAGLDPEAQDQFLLVRHGDDRKQALREDASRDVCIVAIAGNTRSHFDELFDYLRDPAAAVGVEPMMGQGWFLVPPLSAPAAAAPAAAPAAPVVPSVPPAAPPPGA